MAGLLDPIGSIPAHSLGLAPPPAATDARRGKAELEKLRAYERKYPGSYLERSEAAARVEQQEFEGALRHRMHRA